jgi:2-iminobutanoate/2-iminopropanoate deaminase
MDRKIIQTSDAPSAIGPYSQAVVTSHGFVFTAGQIAIDPGTGAIVAGGIREQTARVMESIRAILEASGSGLDHVVKTTVYLADMGEFSEMNEVYGRYFPSQPPARSTVQVARLPRDVRVEIDAIAQVIR